MNPQELDQDVVNLAKGIRQVESGGNFSARGGSGEFGGYQFMPETWKSWSKTHLGREVPLEQASKELQNEVAYKQIKYWKDQGFNPGQIASMWNAGEGKPNAYKENWKGVNDFGVEYDTPAYAKKVAEAYQEIKKGTPVAHAEEPTQTSTQETKKKDLLQTATDVVGAVFPGKQVGESIGALGGYLAAPKEQKEHYDLEAPTPLQVAGDVVQGALTVGAGIPGKIAGAFGKGLQVPALAKSALGRIGQMGGLGAGISTSGSVAQGETNPVELAKTAAIGAGTGAAAGGVGEIFSAATKTLPARFLTSFVPGINRETAEYAVTKSIGTPEKMLKQTEQTISKVGKELGDALNSQEYKGLVIPGKDLFNRVASQHPEAGLTPKELYSKLRTIAPLQKGLIDKLENRGLDLQELHKLNSALGRNTFKTQFDDPAVRAGKELGSSFYHAASDAITSVAPETQPMFATLTKEYPLRTALEKAIKRGWRQKSTNLRDLVLMVGGMPAGPVGVLGGYAASKALSSPTANLGVAGLVQTLNKGLLKPLVPVGLKPTENL